MNRRSALALFAALFAAPAGCLSDPPDPSGPRNPPAAPANAPRDPGKRDLLRITDFDFEEADDGRLRVFGAVENRAESERRATVRATVTTDRKFERTAVVDVPPGETAAFAVVFDLAYKAFAKKGSIDIRLV